VEADEGGAAAGEVEVVVVSEGPLPKTSGTGNPMLMNTEETDVQAVAVMTQSTMEVDHQLGATDSTEEGGDVVDGDKTRTRTRIRTRTKA
jgi:hypothetical protein